MTGESKKFHDPLAVTWTDKYEKQINAVWKRLPTLLGSFLASVAVFTFGATLSGEWLFILVHFSRHLRGESNDTEDASPYEKYPYKNSDSILASYHLQGLQFHLLAAMTVGYGMYFIIGGFLHWYFYMRQRDHPETWKCQPDKWLSPELERHEILWGSISLLVTNITSGFITCYLANGGGSQVYYEFGKFGYAWLLLQIPVIFIYQDFCTYWIHRIYHLPFLYKHFHKLHHTYKQPTAFSVTAIHPIEILNVQLVSLTPLVLFPVHWVIFSAINLYVYYHGIIIHSGIDIKSHWWQPWQPDTMFHDNHHQYFHVNFGFNTTLWDKLFGTMRQKDRIYREDIFYGKGKSLTEATEEELKNEFQERASENPDAHRDASIFDVNLKKNM